MAALKKGLGSKGKGMEALINTQIGNLHNAMDEALVSNKNSIEIDINKIEPNKKQPRKTFEENSLEELASSIKEYGIVQPLIVRKNEDFYEIVAGERRWRAAKIAGLKKVPAIIRDYESDLAFEIALIENIQRENLNPIEEALSYKRLNEEFNLSQDKIAEKVGKNRTTITNSMRLLNLDERVQNFIIEGKITSGHARALLTLTDNEIQFELAEKIIEDCLSVRETENLVKHISELKSKEKENSNEQKSTFDNSSYKKIENDLKNIFGTKVKLSNKKNKGKIEIEYYSNEDLDRLLSIFNKMN